MNGNEVQSALNACAAQGGGRVALPPGEHRCGTLILRDNVELYLSAGATLRPSEDPVDFPPLEGKGWNTAYAPRRDSRCFLYADCARGVSIPGPGTIDFGGTRFCEPDPSPGRINALRLKNREAVPRVILFAGCTDFRLRDFTLLDAPAGWSVWLTGCADGVVQGVRLLSDRELPNADGLHINCCRDVRVSDCRFETGDDALVLRAYNAPHSPDACCERITVANCTLSSNSSAVRVGWCGDGTIRDCLLSNLAIHDAVNGFVCQLPYFQTPAADQGGAVTRVERVQLSNVTMRNIFFEPIHLSVADGVRAEIKNLTFDGVSALSRRMPRFSGTAAYPLRDIALNNCRFDVVPELDTPYRVPTQYWDERSFDGLPLVRRVERLCMNQVEFNNLKED